MDPEPLCQIHRGPKPMMFNYSSKQVFGSLEETRLHLRKRIGYRNSFQTHLTATLSPAAGGTALSGTCAMHPFTWIFMALWLGFALISTFSPEGPGFGLLLLAFGGLLIWIGLYTTRQETRFLTDFLGQTIQTTERKPKRG